MLGPGQEKAEATLKYMDFCSLFLLVTAEV